MHLADQSHYRIVEALRAISDADHFIGGTRDQVMLFTRATSAGNDGQAPTLSSLPAHLRTLESQLSSLLVPHLPADIHRIIFEQPALARQVILNLYPPGKGITSHIDLPHRYADGILGVSLIGSAAMTMSHANTEKGTFHVYLPAGSVYIFTGEARWEWAHGFQEQMADLVQDSDSGESRGVRSIARSLRVSVTYRWMAEGADVLV